MPSLVGYHGTFCDCIESINQNGFISQHNTDHWLGQGIYFYKDDEEQAKVWAFVKRKKHARYLDKEIAVFKVTINIEDNEFLNLNLRKDVNRLIDFAESLLLSADTQLKFDLRNENANRCLLIDYMADKQCIKVVLASYVHQSDAIKRLDATVGFPLGIYFCEQQICVKDKSMVHNMECTYEEHSHKVARWSGPGKRRW